MASRKEKKKTRANSYNKIFKKKKKHQIISIYPRHGHQSFPCSAWPPPLDIGKTPKQKEEKRYQRRGLCLAFVNSESKIKESKVPFMTPYCIHAERTPRGHIDV
jgi:hypothetical protein